MNTDQFTKILIAVLLVLQISCVLIVVKLWEYFGWKGVIGGCLLGFVLTVGVVKAVRSIHIYDKSGNPVDKIDDAIDSMIAATMWVVISSVLSIIAGMLLTNHSANQKGILTFRNKAHLMLLPVLAVGVFYAGFAFEVRVVN